MPPLPGSRSVHADSPPSSTCNPRKLLRASRRRTASQALGSAAAASSACCSLTQNTAVVSAADYEREPLAYLAGFAAGKAFVRYRRGGGEKRSPMPDLYIGAHAAITGYRLLTRDVRRYRTYFPTIDIIAPPQAEDETA